MRSRSASSRGSICIARSAGIAGDNVIDRFLHIDVFVPRTHACERLIETESAAAAAADVVLPKHRALRAGILLEQFPHRNVWINCSRGVHADMN
jgi:hypothetical protein